MCIGCILNVNNREKSQLLVYNFFAMYVIISSSLVLNRTFRTYRRTGHYKDRPCIVYKTTGLIRANNIVVWETCFCHKILGRPESLKIEKLLGNISLWAELLSR